MHRTTRTGFLAAALMATATFAPAIGAQQPAPPPPRGDARPPMGGDMDGMHHVGPGERPMRRMGSPGGGMGRMGPRRGGVAGMLLGQTAQLKLSDAQVTRLAAIARADAARDTAMRASMDSVHRAMMAAPRGTAGANGGMPHMTPEMESRMKTAHDQVHASVRDALAVLTPDQLAMAWEMRGGFGPGRMPMPRR